jgi:hypothetical protein
MSTAIEWTDATSYQQGQRGKIEPTGWEAKIRGHRVYITKGHLYHREIWVMNCLPVGIREHRLCMNTEPVEHARSLALSRVHAAALRNADELLKLASAIEDAREATR